MAILRYISATSAPISPDSSTPPPSIPNPRLTKAVFPKKKPEKWSTGVAPGEYGGPPTTSYPKLRKYAGGDGKDPLTSDDYIWNREFMPSMKRLLDNTESPFLKSPSTQEEESGFLSLNRAMSLDSMDVDLSKELMAPAQPVIEIPVEDLSKSSGIKVRKWRAAPTNREKDKWDREAKAATGGSVVMFREVRQPQGDPAVLAAQTREQYFKLKRKLQILTLGVGGVGLVSSYVSYSPEVAASFGAGFIGSLVYLRMLGTSVDAMADGARGLLKGAIGQPRLLVPVVLVMFYNRWNGIAVPEYGMMQLQLIPMLVGFFTYKIATFVQTIEEAVTYDSKKDPNLS